MFLKILIVLLSIFGMEVISWCIHKYIMHGLLWKIHKTHHLPSKSFFELNDLFSISFGAIAIALMMIGFKSFDFLFFIGLGITCYGMLYFVLHDLIVHQRIKVNSRLNNFYLRAVIRAHKRHHKHLEREGSESFGLLWVNKKYFQHKEENKIQ